MGSGGLIEILICFLSVGMRPGAMERRETAFDIALDRQLPQDVVKNIGIKAPRIITGSLWLSLLHPLFNRGSKLLSRNDGGRPPRRPLPRPESQMS